MGMSENDLVNLSKKGILHFAGLDRYIKAAVDQVKIHDLVSAIDRDEWISFNSFNSYTQRWNRYEAILEQNLKKFDIYLVYENDRTEIGSVPVDQVLPISKIKADGLPMSKPNKSSNSISASHPKSNTAKKTKTTRKTSRKSTSRHKKGRKATRSRTRKRK